MVKGMSIVALQTLFRKEFNEAVTAYANTNAWDAVSEIGTMVASTGPGEDYRWLQELPEFQRWIGDLNVSDLAEYRYAIANEEFAAAVGVHKNEIDDDADGIILNRIRSMAGGEKRKWGKLLHEVLLAGTTGLAFDGIAFFSDATGVRLNDNLLAGTISAGTPTVAQAAADIITVRKAMMGFKDSRGEIVGVVPDTWVIPPNLEQAFRSLQTSTADPTSSNAGTANQFKQYLQRIVVDPGLTDANDFYALSTANPGVAALVKQQRSALEMFLDATQVNVNRKMIFGGAFRGNVGYGLPILAVKVVSAVA